jgi:hypothetical protein
MATSRMRKNRGRGGLPGSAFTPRQGWPRGVLRLGLCRTPDCGRADLANGPWPTRPGGA